MKRLFASLALCCTALCPTPAALAAPPGAQPAAGLPATLQDWRLAALRDIEAGYRVTLDNHAGARDPHNPAFLANLGAAKAHGLALAAKVTNGSGYLAALLGFTNRIHDGHAGVYPAIDFDTVQAAEWPGFVAAWRGELYVYKAEEGAASAGERIVSCDGVPVRRLIEDKVFAFMGRSDEEGQWWDHAHDLFRDWGNPFAPRPQRCVFEANGRQDERALRWRTMPQSATSWWYDSVRGAPLPLGLSEPRPNLFWVAMPSFNPNEQERKAYRELYRQVQAGRERLLGADAVVIDLRANGGGSSLWSLDFAKALWGEDRVARRRAAYGARTEVWYRASPGNIAYFQKMAQEKTAQGETAVAEIVNAYAQNLLAARSAGQDYYISKNDAPPPALDPMADQPGDPAPFTRPTYVIVPGDCASACLDAIDYFKLFPNTKLVGAPSSADSTYMEVRVEQLPGGLARVIVPTKLYVHRPRGNGAFYRPDIPVIALDWSTATFLGVVEQDLARLPGSGKSVAGVDAAQP